MKPAVALGAVALLILECAWPAGVAQAQGSASEAECSAIATQQTGFDPTRPPPPQAQPNMQVAGTGARARGAAAGAIIGGASGGDAGKGAAAGMVAGGVTQRSRSRRAARSYNAATTQQEQAGRAAWDQARTACLAGRNDVVR